uniref:RRM domain-containing protein n=1 Tax=Ditylenchus dipsaci TaxID=166011 RepID=A0A915DQF8_9BILA
METDLHHPSPQKSHPCTSSATFSNSRSMKTRVSHPNRPMADKHHGHHQNGPSSSQSASVPSWKKMPTPIGFDPKENLFRVHGVCKEYPEYNVRDVRDPRIQKFKANNVMELPVPDFLVDDQYTAKFLRSLCKSDPAQVIVFHHPKTRRHLGLAFMDFNTKAESEAFIKKFNGKTLMGGKVNCFFDPLAYEISKLHAEATGGFVVPMPERYTHLITSKSICRMRDLVKKHYGDGQQDDSPVFIKQEHVVGKKAITPPEIEQAPAATNGTSSAKKCSQTPSGSQPRPATLKDAADLSLELDKTHVNHDGHTSCTSLSTSTTNFALSNSNGRPLNSHLMADPVTDQDQENVTSLDESLDNFPRRMSRFKRHLLSEHLQSAVDLQNQP